MARLTDDIEKMLDFMGLERMAARLDAMERSPEFSSLDREQFLRELVSDSYSSYCSTMLERGLRLAKLRGRGGDISSLHTHGGRVYNDPIVEQVKTLEFIEDGLNVCVFGASDSGKTYFLDTIGVEACRRGFRVLAVDFMFLLDELEMLREHDMRKYYKRMNYYIHIPLLVIDDFLADSTGNSRTSMLFQLIKGRQEKGCSTMIGCQYSPDEWPEMMVETRKKGEADSIRRRLVNNAFIVQIEKS